MRVVFWTASTDGSSFYRATLPGRALTWQGHTVTESTVVNSSLIRAADVVIGSRVARESASRYWAKLHDEGKHLVLDLDDDYFSVEERNVAAWKFWGRPEVLDRLRANLALADVVTTASEGIAESVRAQVPQARVVVVPNGLPAQYLAHPRDYRSDTAIIGWAGTASTVTDFDMITRALNRELRNGRSTVRVIGATGQQVAARGLRGTAVEWTEWVPSVPSYLGVVNSFDVLLAPYRDTAFNRAKFPTKALEAGFLGVPLIASNIRPYSEWITHGVDGFLVDEDHQWGRYLNLLVSDQALRERIGQASRSRAAANIMQHLGERWEEAITP
jgi:glycosyltransferase involved in cell wall biosynthesis